MKKTVQSLLASRRGVTLMELVITFALVGIFCVVTTYMITATAGVFRSVSLRTDAQTVSQILMEKISGELAAAQPGLSGAAPLTIADGSENENDVPLTANAGVSFCSRTGNPVYLTTCREEDGTKTYGQGGYLVLHYRPVSNQAKTLDAVDWTFDAALYDGFRIESLTVFPVAESGAVLNTGSAQTNVLQVNLTLQKDTYTYQDTRYVQCYNFSSSGSYLQYGGIPTDQAAS